MATKRKTGDEGSERKGPSFEGRVRDEVKMLIEDTGFTKQAEFEDALKGYDKELAEAIRKELIKIGKLPEEGGDEKGEGEDDAEGATEEGEGSEQGKSEQQEVEDPQASALLDAIEEEYAKLASGKGGKPDLAQFKDSFGALPSDAARGEVFDVLQQWGFTEDELKRIRPAAASRLRTEKVGQYNGEDEEVGEGGAGGGGNGGEDGGERRERQRMTFIGYDSTGFSRRVIRGKERDVVRVIKQEEETDTETRESTSIIKPPNLEDAEEARGRFCGALDEIRRSLMRDHGLLEDEGDERQLVSFRLSADENGPVAQVFLGNEFYSTVPIPENIRKDIQPKQRGGQQEQQKPKFKATPLFNAWRAPREHEFFDQLVIKQLEERGYQFEKKEAVERPRVFQSGDEVLIFDINGELTESKNRGYIVRAVTDAEGKALDEYIVRVNDKEFQYPARRLQFFDKEREREAMHGLADTLFNKIETGKTEARERMLEVLRRLALNERAPSALRASDYKKALEVFTALKGTAGVFSEGAKELADVLALNLGYLQKRLELEETALQRLDASALFKVGDKILWRDADNNPSEATILSRNRDDVVWRYTVRIQGRDYSAEEGRLSFLDQSVEKQVLTNLVGNMAAISEEIGIPSATFTRLSEGLANSRWMDIVASLAEDFQDFPDRMPDVTPREVRQYLLGALRQFGTRFHYFLRFVERPQQEETPQAAQVEQHLAAGEAHAAGEPGEQGKSGFERHLKWLIPIGLALSYWAATELERPPRRPDWRPVIPSVSAGEAPGPTPEPEVPQVQPAPAETPQVAPVTEAPSRPAGAGRERAAVSDEKRMENLLESTVDKLRRESRHAGRNLQSPARGAKLDELIQYYQTQLIPYLKTAPVLFVPRELVAGLRTQLTEMEQIIARADAAKQLALRAEQAEQKNLQDAGSAAIAADAARQRERAEVVSDRAMYRKSIKNAIESNYGDDADAQTRLNRVSEALLEIRQAFFDLENKIRGEMELDDRARGIYLKKLAQLRERQLGDLRDLLQKTKKSDAVEEFLPRLEASVARFVRIQGSVERKIVYDAYVADLLTVATPPTVGVMPFNPNMFTIAARRGLDRAAGASELPALTPDRPVRVSGNALEALDARNVPHSFSLPEGVTAEFAAGIRDITFKSGPFSVTGSVVADLNGNFGMVVEGTSVPLADKLRNLQQGR